jgi:hypothetical protein
MTVWGYCKLCREKEIELYRTVLTRGVRKHEEACRQAGCGHPPVYRFLGVALKEQLNRKTKSEER